MQEANAINDEITAAVDKSACEARDILKDLIRIRSFSGSETQAIELCRNRFARAGCECELVPVPQSITEDPDYSRTDQPISYEGRSNLVAVRKGSGGGKSVIVQSHVDVVPADGWDDAFAPRDDGQFIFGRGACDAKGPVAAIWLAMKALADIGFRPSGDMQAQIVIEEEFGGNGALALIGQGYRADAVIVVEPSQLQIHPANRGCVWFQIEIEGLSAHMGRKYEAISAVDLACKVINALYDYERRLVADSANYPGFERYTNPVQVNIGMLNAGNWPSTVPGSAIIEGGVGFLPNRSREQVKQEIKTAIESIDDPWLLSHYRLGFNKLHNDSYEIAYDHPAVLALHEAALAAGIESEVFGWNVSCDARLYSRIGGMPTVVFGPGSVTDAHGTEEKVEFAQVVKAAEAIVRFVMDWCT